MHSHISAVRNVTRKLTVVFSVAARQKSCIYPKTIRSAKFISSSSFSSVKMGETLSAPAESKNPERPGKIQLSDQEWKQKLTPQEYNVARQHGTEQAWTGSLLDNKATGKYTCTCCGAELFLSSTKFDSGSGWPSFNDVLKDKDASNIPAVDLLQDKSASMVRTEVRCGKCDAHLGHVFNDGPGPTGLRYCINSVCLKFKPENK